MSPMRPGRECAVAKCDRDAYARDWCVRHYARWKKYGDPEHLEKPPFQTCTVDDCTALNYGQGLCRNHWTRLRRTGRIHVSPKPTSEARFRAKISPKDGPCWSWQAERDSDGYGYFWADGKRHRAHRWSYEHFVGPIPAGLEVDHMCGNRACVNPEHLEPVTSIENLRRARERALAP